MHATLGGGQGLGRQQRRKGQGGEGGPGQSTQHSSASRLYAIQSGVRKQSSCVRHQLPPSRGDFAHQGVTFSRPSAPV